MIAVVEFPEALATFEDGVWACNNKTLEGQLNILVDPEGPSGADPRPHITEAQKAIDLFGGSILRADEPELVPGRVY